MNFDHRVNLLKKVAVQENWQMVHIIELNLILIYLCNSDEGGGFYRLGYRWCSHPLRALAKFFVFLIVFKSFSCAKSIFAYDFLVQRRDSCIQFLFLLRAG